MEIEVTRCDCGMCKKEHTAVSKHTVERVVHTCHMKTWYRVLIMAEQL